MGLIITWSGLLVDGMTVRKSLFDGTLQYMSVPIIDNTSALKIT